MIALSPEELSLLREVRTADEDHGGLHAEELTAEELNVLVQLCDRGLVEALGEFGEAPDGEEDEREAGGGQGARYRVTALGVEAILSTP